MRRDTLERRPMSFTTAGVRNRPRTSAVFGLGAPSAAPIGCITIRAGPRGVRISPPGNDSMALERQLARKGARSRETGWTPPGGWQVERWLGQGQGL